MQEQQELLQRRLIQAEHNAALVRSELSHNVQIYMHDVEFLWRGPSNLIYAAGLEVLAVQTNACRLLTFVAWNKARLVL